MATSTPKLALYKADPSEYVDVDTDINDNYDKIDANLPNFVCTSGTRPGAPFVGMVIYETNTGVTRLWDGTIWRTQGVTVCTSVTRPSNPVVGDMIYETDTDRQLLRTSDNKWTVTLATYRQIVTLNVDQNLLSAPTAAQARILTIAKATDGIAIYRLSAQWPGLKVSAGGPAVGTDAVAVELGYGDAGAILGTGQRIYTGVGASVAQAQAGGSVDVEFTPAAGAGNIFYLRMYEFAGAIATWVLFNTGVGVTKFTLQEQPGSKY